MDGKLTRDGRAQALQAFFERWAPGLMAEARQDLGVLLPIAQSGVELILGQSAQQLGILVKGNGKEFCQGILDMAGPYGAPAELMQRVNGIANLARHRNGYCKLEWSVGAPLRRKLSVYYRNMPEMEGMREWLEQEGVSRRVTEQLGFYAEMLQKESPHFLAVTATDGEAPIWKLYFTQWVTQETYAIVQRRVLSLMEIVGVSPRAASLTAQAWPQLLPLGQGRSLFVSISFDDAQVLPTLKLDFEQVELAALSALGMEGDGPASELCTLLQRDRLSYLGVKLGQGERPLLKYYLDSEDF